MSRIGQSPVPIPQGVTVEKTGSDLKVSGPKGSLNLKLTPEIKVEIKENQIIVKRKNDQKRIKALHGMTRNLIANMIEGIVNGWSKNLELVGVGFRAQSNEDRITLNVGFSHSVEIAAKEGITFEVFDNTKIKVFGFDKQLVGQVAANIRSVRPPDVYKGKGIRYEGEYVRKKLGKSGKVGALGAGAAGGGIGGK